MPKSADLEVNRGGAWKRISVQEAIDSNERGGRCTECHKPVRVHKASVSGKPAAHVEHLNRNLKCSLGDQGYAL
jgi:hypothetical protein